jgi:chromosome segregation ATPase
MLIQIIMNRALPELPETDADWRAHALDVRQLYNNLQVELDQRLQEIEALKAQVKDLRRAQFGQSSERLNEQIEDVEQLIDELEENHAAATARYQAILGAVCDDKTSAPVKGVPCANLCRIIFRMNGSNTRRRAYAPAVAAPD